MVCPSNSFNKVWDVMKGGEPRYFQPDMDIIQVSSPSSITEWNIFLSKHWTDSWNASWCETCDQLYSTSKETIFDFEGLIPPMADSKPFL